MINNNFLSILTLLINFIHILSASAWLAGAIIILPGNKIKLNCDCLGISGGWTPMVHMHTQSGGKLDFKNDDQVFIPKEIDNISFLFLIFTFDLML